MASISTLVAAVPPDGWTYSGADPVTVVDNGYGPAFEMVLYPEGYFPQYFTSDIYDLDAPLILRIDLPESRTVAWESDGTEPSQTANLEWGARLPGEAYGTWVARNTGRTVETRGWFSVELWTATDAYWIGLVVDNGAEEEEGTDKMRLAYWTHSPTADDPYGATGGPNYFGPEDINSYSSFYIKIEKWGEFLDTARLRFSEDGETWDETTESIGLEALDTTTRVYLGATGRKHEEFLSEWGPGWDPAQSILLSPQPHVFVPPEEHPGWDEGWTDFDEDAEFEDYPDTYDPDAIAPAVPQFNCSSVLDQILTFSRLVHRPIRIVSGNQISLVDVNAEGIPDGWHNFEDKLYVEASKQVQAGAHTLSLDRANRTVTASASFKKDDVRILAARHRVPAMLPTFGGQPPAPVSRVRLTFTAEGMEPGMAVPGHFQASVEFHIADEGGS